MSCVCKHNEQARFCDLGIDQMTIEKGEFNHKYFNRKRNKLAIQWFLAIKLDLSN